MDQEKIGKFIAECRKEKKITQSELAEYLGVTDRSVSNWENGKNMPDLSLFKPLCTKLDITINDLMSGERIDKEKYQEKFEENIVNTIDYSTKRLSKYDKLISLILIIFGLFISLTAIMIFPSESSWGSIYSVFGIAIFMVGIVRMTKSIEWPKRILLISTIFLGSIGVLLFSDYINVRMNDEAPMFRTKTIYIGNVTFYDTLFYDVYRCDFDTENEHWKIVGNKKYDDETLMNYCK